MTPKTLPIDKYWTLGRWAREHGIAHTRASQLVRMGRIEGSQLIGGREFIVPPDAKVLPPSQCPLMMPCLKHGTVHGGLFADMGITEEQDND